MYDPKLDSWTFVAAMCAHGGGVGVGVIPFHNKPNSQNKSKNDCKINAHKSAE